MVIVCAAMKNLFSFILIFGELPGECHIIILIIIIIMA